jgi:hypothetical protein
MDAECTLFHHAARSLFHLRVTPIRCITTRFGSLPVERTGSVRTGYHAVATADAFIIVHHHYPVPAHIGGSYRANIGAGWVGAVQAGAGKKVVFTASHLFSGDNVPVDIIG